MSSEPPAWNAWDVPFFGGTAGPSVPPPRSEVVVPLAGDGSGAAERIWAVFIAIGGVVGGAAAVVGMFILSFVLSFGSEPSRAERVFIFGLGAAIAVGGIVIAVLTYRSAGIRSEVRITPGEIEIRYRTFRGPLVVPRAAVRAVAVDESPVILFTKNHRFPIRGHLPEHVFADALDNMPRPPWEDLDPEAQLGPIASAVPGGPIPHSRDGHLWSGDGSSLPFLRLGPGDVPNVAIVFEGRRRTPRPPWWLPFTASIKRAPMFIGGRAVGGLLMRLRDPHAVAAAIEDWGLVRDVTAEDIVDQGLLVAKPLRGWRAFAYAALFLIPFVLQLLLRRW